VTRDFAALTKDRFDLLVVGGGVHGLFAAYDAALRGLKVALVDRGDFGGGLSFNHQRTIHGGLRALEQGNVAKARRQVHERRTWALIAPHLLRPLPFLVGTYRFSKRSRTVVRVGFKAYDLVGRGRNHGVSPELHLPRTKLESAAATKRLFPGISESGLSGGAVWYDYQTIHPDRLMWSLAMAAIDAGATLVNYAEVRAPLRSGAKIEGARVKDGIGGAEADVTAAVTLLAAGCHLGTLMKTFEVRGAPALLRAMNLLLDRPARDIAVAAPSPGGRMLTIVPWRGFQLAGTHQSTTFVEAGEQQPPLESIEAFLSDLDATFPRLRATPADVRFVHHGLTPAVMRKGRAELLSEAKVIRHSREGTRGLVSLVGVKLTTARLAAAQAVDAVASELGRASGRSRTGDRPLPHAGIADVEGRLLETLRDLGASLDRDVIAHLTGWYGTEASPLAEFAAAGGGFGRLTPSLPILEAEFAYAAMHGGAVHLADAVLRRTPLGSAGHPGRPPLEKAADVMAEVLDWSAERKAEELAAVERVYPAAPPATARRMP
jgi:glycerol-3-phosphate dehydrogenase